ncbi:lysophospholipid acyltransferase family protein [uncultured Friedmanniella sp.]|uniref:lysophospholipid acyltransferase family protein n=1 Tax=uncultured Friedmanniella sp. TaxID=335381 RepID=UPI0035CB33AD
MGGSGDAPTTVLRPLREANVEPGERAIFRTVSLLHAVARPLTRLDWRQQDRLPRTGGVIIVANHISNVDPIALGQYLAFSGRWPRFLAKASLFRVPVVGAVIRACGQIPVQRHSAAAKDALAAAVTAVDQGRAVVVYPEGTISRDPDLWPMRGHTGAARIALATRAPVVPVGQWGAQDILYGNHLGVPRLLPRKTFRLVTGEPVPLDDLREGPVTAEVLAEATTRIMDAITALVAELRQDEPPAVRFDPRQPAGVAP